ncbi:low molecular weight protein tyrosine phosphatase family protein [Desulfogranum japonicum]|uniref:low molecular weight protein tyrosine phosphatase family protein n=1 Tax=Desulfogranum japonicum TaxID=231447 RepID=UPI00048A999D
MKNILFICSQNKLRSPTAETIFSDKEGFDVLSAGLNNDAEIPLTKELVEWAETIFVMEKSQKNKLQKKFRKSLNKQRVICLDIPDDYEYMQPELVTIFNSKLDNFFKIK